MEATIYCNTSNATDAAFMLYAMVAISQGLSHNNNNNNLNKEMILLQPSST